MVAGTLPPGNAASIRSSVWMIGSLRDMPSVPGALNCMPSAGIDSATRTPPAASTEISGRARTRSRMAPQTRDSPPELRRRAHGTRPFSSQPFSARNESSAGRTVSDPTTATPTTMIVPIPKETKIGLPEKNMPAIAAITVRPEITTARPDVAAATCSAASQARPWRCSSTIRRR